jgi:perosamine synthetase
MIPIYKIYQTKKTVEYVNQVLESNWLTTGGYFNQAAEEKLKEILNCKYVLLTNNGTTASHLLNKIIKKKNNNINKIICQDNVYVAAWNSFLFDNNIQLEIIDIDNKTWNFDAEKLAEKLHNNSPENTAVLVVHNIGNPFVFNNDKFLMVEDNCEGFLGSYNNIKTGTAKNCLASSISFFANKHITSGEGGAVITNDENSYLYAKNLHGQGQSETRFIHNNLGYNYRMTNLTAAVLLSQIEVIDEILIKKRNIFEKYKQGLKNIEEIQYQKINLNCEHSNWLFGIRINNSKYNIANKFFESKKIETRPMFYSAKEQPYLQDYIIQGKVKLDIKNTKINDEIIFFPSYPDLTNIEIEYIIKMIKEYLESIK